jgi:hypothetical protein
LIASPQEYTAKAAQAALAAAAAAAHVAAERRHKTGAPTPSSFSSPPRATRTGIGALDTQFGASAIENTAARANAIQSTGETATTTTPNSTPISSERQIPAIDSPATKAAIGTGAIADEALARASPMTGERKKPIAFSPNTYKTEICRSHATTGYCEYGAYCQFAHGVSELRSRDFDVKYKTKLCKNFFETGQCRFASRCKFIHDEQRVQVSDTEFWLVSPSDNLVRVEVAHTPERRAQLQSLVTSTFSPPATAFGAPTTFQPHSVMPTYTVNVAPVSSAPSPLFLADLSGSLPNVPVQTLGSPQLQTRVLYSPSNAPSTVTPVTTQLSLPLSAVASPSTTLREMHAMPPLVNEGAIASEVNSGAHDSPDLSGLINQFSQLMPAPPTFAGPSVVPCGYAYPTPLFCANTPPLAAPPQFGASANPIAVANAPVSVPPATSVPLMPSVPQAHGYPPPIMSMAQPRQQRSPVYAPSQLPQTMPPPTAPHSPFAAPPAHFAAAKFVAPAAVPVPGPASRPEMGSRSGSK